MLYHPHHRRIRKLWVREFRQSTSITSKDLHHHQTPRSICLHHSQRQSNHNPIEFPNGNRIHWILQCHCRFKKKIFPPFFVHHDIRVTLTVSAMKYSEHNVMSTLQFLRTWVTFNKFSTHRVASIAFLKYVSIYLTLHSTEKSVLQTH